VGRIPTEAETARRPELYRRATSTRSFGGGPSAKPQIAPFCAAVSPLTGPILGEQNGGYGAISIVDRYVRRCQRVSMAAIAPASLPEGLPSAPSVHHRLVDVASAVGPVRIHLAEAGTGEPVLLLHGWPQHWFMWRHVVAGLGGRYRLLMPDLRGFGWSQAPGTGYEPHSFAADARALLDALGLEGVRLVGHDWGGFTAFLLGVAHPERFKRIVVFNAPPLWVPLSPRVIASLWRTWYVTMVACPLGPAIVASDWFVPWFIRLGRRAAVFDDTEADIYARRLGDPARAWASAVLYRSYLRAAGDVFIRRRYRHERLTVPTLLVFGAEDFYVPRSYITGWQSHAPHMRAEFVPGCGHFLPEERPELPSSYLREFLL
jgi:pimeloyl-ACP methyl ester carboxylesterase